MSHSDVGCLDDEEREIYGQAIAEAGLVGAHAVERMLAADPAWAKFLWRGNPRFSKQVWIEYERILAGGLRLRPDIDGEWGDGVVSMDDQELSRVRIGDEPQHFLRVSLEEAARRPQIIAEAQSDLEECEVRTDWRRRDVELAVPLIGADHAGVVKTLAALRGRLTAPDAVPEPTCVETLRRAGIGVPRALAEIAVRVEEVHPWHWSSSPAYDDPVAEYLMRDREWVTSVVPDALVLSDCGRGGFTVRMAFGPVALYAQVSSDGSGPRANVNVTRLLHEVARVVEAVQKAGWSAEERGRDVAIRLSELDGSATLTFWDNRRRTWTERELSPGTIWDESLRALQSRG